MQHQATPQCPEPALPGQCSPPVPCPLGAWAGARFLQPPVSGATSSPSRSCLGHRRRHGCPRGSACPGEVSPLPVLPAGLWALHRPTPCQGLESLSLAFGHGLSEPSCAQGSTFSVLLVLVVTICTENTPLFLFLKMFSPVSGTYKKDAPRQAEQKEFGPAARCLPCVGVREAHADRGFSDRLWPEHRRSGAYRYAKHVLSAACLVGPWAGGCRAQSPCCAHRQAGGCAGVPSHCWASVSGPGAALAWAAGAILRDTFLLVLPPAPHVWPLVQV